MEGVWGKRDEEEAKGGLNQESQAEPGDPFCVGHHNSDRHALHGTFIHHYGLIIFSLFFPCIYLQMHYSISKAQKKEQDQTLQDCDECN